MPRTSRRGATARPRRRTTTATTTKRRSVRRSGKSDKISRAKEKIAPASDFDYLRLLVYGQNGKGKTRFGASGPNVLLIDCNEKGSLSIRHYPAQVFRVETWTDIDLAYWL